MTMRLLTIAWMLMAVTTWICCSCEGAIFYGPVDQEPRWYVPRSQDILDTNLLDLPTFDKRNGGSMQGESPRSRPSLSIVNSLDVLRQKLMYEVARRHVDENNKVLTQNNQILRNLGKRSLMSILGVARRF
ncbi:uncharacterized protein LOC126834345 [Adelges cooleyi]|uniref:uncharacterized protein LOC126834345 n=1 Tax=Adelges cooleyi TaxID=133065 RepID=UPI00217FC845|nr:uncharacterized protein LOC126834345 [Adelges cooleyi]XP_050422157.1 uncharacterized protein LOC126834345 [Adelges cooleyi]XP_050422158.1 uncharacterized protein LOC126834345 [Adelges cooleyi]XP_050422159.1 uncharacterized protein LOC126834345 [Adelges cooleyi]